MSLKFGILKETKERQDRRAPFSPKQLEHLIALYPYAHFQIESSSNRIFTDEEYKHSGVMVVPTITDCDVYIGINSISSEDRVPNKQYLFVSEVVNSIQPIFTLDTVTGCVGAYNAFRAFGLKFELFKLPSVATFLDQPTLLSYLKRLVIPPLKILIIGNGEKVLGAREVMKAMKIKEVVVSNFIAKNYAQAVFTVIESADSIDSELCVKVSDICITDSFIEGKPVVISQDWLQSTACKLRVIVDLEPNTTNLISSTVRQSTSDEPFYGYLPKENIEVDLYHPAAIVVVAVPDVRLEFPKESSEYIGNQLVQHFIPSFLTVKE